MEKIILLLSDARGSYIPRDFIEMIESQPKWQGITAENKEILRNPDHEWYWEAWEDVLNRAFITVRNRKYTLHQDGDLWAVAYSAMTKKEKIEFFGND